MGTNGLNAVNSCGESSDDGCGCQLAVVRRCTRAWRDIVFAKSVPFERRFGMRLLDRRRFFTWGSVLGTLGMRFSRRTLLAAPQSANVYARIGLRPIVNASGTYTHLG